MKEFTSGDIRNFAVVGHGAAGKTVLCEAMLSCAGEINRMGSIEDQNTISDYAIKKIIKIWKKICHLKFIKNKSHKDSLKTLLKLVNRPVTKEINQMVHFSAFW